MALISRIGFFAVLLPAVFSAVAGLEWLLSDEQLAIIATVRLVLVTLVVAVFKNANTIVMRYMRDTINENFKDLIRDFQLELEEIRFENLMEMQGRYFEPHMMAPAGRWGVGANFRFCEIPDVVKTLMSHSQVTSEDGTLEDELQILDLLDTYAARARAQTMTVEDLEIFVKLDNVLLIQGTEAIETMIELKGELSNPLSPCIRRLP